MTQLTKSIIQQRLERLKWLKDIGPGKRGGIELMGCLGADDVGEESFKSATKILIDDIDKQIKQIEVELSRLGDTSPLI